MENRKSIGGVHMYNVIDVCNYIISYCRKKGYEITNLRLQKILYFIQAFFLQEINTPCFENQMEAWDLGPVVPEAYHFFKEFGSKPLSEKKGSTSQDIELDDKNRINEVLDCLSKYSTYQLVNITHNQKPWKKNHKKYENNPIPIEDIRSIIEHGN